MKKQPNINKWKCHNSQRMVLGGFLLEEEKQPTYCKISSKVDVIKLVPTRLANTRAHT